MSYSNDHELAHLVQHHLDDISSFRDHSVVYCCADDHGISWSVHWITTVFVQLVNVQCSSPICLINKVL